MGVQKSSLTSIANAWSISIVPLADVSCPVDLQSISLLARCFLVEGSEGYFALDDDCRRLELEESLGPEDAMAYLDIGFIDRVVFDVL